MTVGKDDSARRRILRFLSRGAARIRQSARDSHVLIDGGDRGALSAAEGLLATLVREDLIRIDAGIVSLHGKARTVPAERPVADALRPRMRECEAIVLRTEAGPDTVVVINHAESPLALLRRHRAKDGSRFLNDREFLAGERLRLDYGRGQIMPRMGMNWDAAGASGRKHADVNGTGNLTDTTLAARDRVEKAIEAVGPELSGVLIDVCCFLKGLERVEAERGWPARSAKVVLKSALAVLARHYEPQRSQRSHTRQTPILHWGATDYRPKIG